MRSIEKKPNRVENVFCFLKLENVLWNITYSTANQKRKRKKRVILVPQLILQLYYNFAI